MRRTAVTRNAAVQDRARIEALALQVGRLVRHPGYRRERIVSPLLLRQLPTDAGYAWRGEASLRTRLVEAGLDDASLDHLILNTRSEIAKLRGPADA